MAKNDLIGIRELGARKELGETLISYLSMARNMLEQAKMNDFETNIANAKKYIKDAEDVYSELQHPSIQYKENK